MPQGKTAIATGAASDLGNAMARQLAKNGNRNALWQTTAIRPSHGGISVKEKRI